MSKIEFLFRWTHVWAGIIWIGHLYFFNFVNIKLQGKMDDPTKKLVNPQLMPRALWWFRWGAMATFLSGLILFAVIYFYTPGIGWGANMLFRGAEGQTDRARWIEWGMLFGSIMWFNVWFIIMPNQNKVMGVTQATPDEVNAARRMAGLTSRVNTLLSIPMLYCMVFAAHYY